MQDYENALFENNIKKAQYNRIIFDRRLGTQTTKETSKKTVNPLYMKMRVMNDLITVKPHLKENSLLWKLNKFIIDIYLWLFYFYNFVFC